MARYRDAVCKLCRAEGTKLYLKSDRCNSFKCAIEKKAYGPGMHGGARRFKKSDFGIQLREKQKAKRFYGLLEKQFKNYFQVADRMEGMTGQNLLILIERRLDNFVVKSGLIQSKAQARQLIVHRHFLVNGQRVDRPSYLLKENDIISVKNDSKEIDIFKQLKEEGRTSTEIPVWIELSVDKLEAKVLRLPIRDDITNPINEQLIVELYSK
ncbi:MAG: 30S ribosomal protein S4 [bacterium]|nr:30S ribosomal protein S4 [bacterium]